MNDDLLRKGYRAGRGPAPPSVPPTADELARLVRGAGPEGERLEILDRALAHPESARELELLRAVSAAEQSEAGSRAVRWRVPLALAATVMLAVSATLLVLSRQEPEILRASRAGGTPAPITPRDAVVQAPGNISFVWHPVPQASGYRLELLSEAGVLVSTRNTVDTTMTLRVEGVGPYRWVLVALLPDGAEVLSRPRRLTIAP